MIELHDLEKLLPQRPPILMLDRVVDIEPGVSATGVRRFVPGDACFAGHFPGNPVLPGVLAIEAFAQTLLVVMMSRYTRDAAVPTRNLPLGYLARVNEMSFHRPIEPGQEISFSVAVERELGQFTIAACRATDGDVLCAKGSLTVAMDRKALAAALDASSGGE